MAGKVLRDRKEPAREFPLGKNLDGHALERLRVFFSDRIKERPVEVYADILTLLRGPCKSATREFKDGLEDIARSAARNSLRDFRLVREPPKKTEVNIRYIDYLLFIEYHEWCSLRLHQFLGTEKLIKETDSADCVWYNPKCGVCDPFTGENFFVPVPAPKNGNYATTWWVEHWKKVIAAVGERPCEETFANDPNWAPTLQALKKKCSACHQRAKEEYPRFKQRVAEKITNLINDVRSRSIDMLTKTLTVHLTGPIRDPALTFVAHIVLSTFPPHLGCFIGFLVSPYLRHCNTSIYSPSHVLSQSPLPVVDPPGFVVLTFRQFRC